MASLSTCHLGLWLGWQILLNNIQILLVLYDYMNGKFFLFKQKYARTPHDILDGRVFFCGTNELSIPTQFICEDFNI